MKSIYSAQEQRVLKLIPKDGQPIDTKTIRDGVYSGPHGPAPISAKQSIMVTINNLIRKSDIYKEKFIIRKSEPRGPYPSELWMEPRKNRRKRKHL